MSSAEINGIPIAQIAEFNGIPIASIAEFNGIGLAPPVSAPTVDAGGPYTGDALTAIALNATVVPGSDPSPVLLWTIDSGGTGTFSDNSIEDPTFTPDQTGAYVLRLSADPNDGPAVEDTASLTSNVIAPTVGAGGPYTGDVSTAIQLDGTIVPGTDLSPTVLWTITAGGTGTFLPNASTIDATFTPDSVSTYTLQLSADPSDGSPVTDTASLDSQAAGAVTVYIDDNFTGTDGDPVLGRVPDTVDYLGGVWANLATDPSPTIQSNEAFWPATGGGDTRGRNTMAIDLPSADFVVIAEGARAAEPGQSVSRVEVTVRNTSNDNNPSWAVQAFVGPDATGNFRLREGTNTLDSVTMPAALGETGTITVTCEGQTITGRWQSPSADETVTYALAAVNEFVAVAGFGGDRGAVVDRFRVEALPGPTVYIEDSFTDTDGTAIIGRAPDVVDYLGGVWLTANGGISPIVITNNQVQTTEDLRNAVNINLPSADFIASMDCISLVGAQSFYQVTGRNTATGGDPSWLASAFTGAGGNGAVTLKETFATRDTATIPGAIGESGAIVFRFEGTNITADFNFPSESVQLSYVGTRNQTVTVAGFGVNNGVMDNFKVVAVV